MYLPIERQDESWLGHNLFLPKREMAEDAGGDDELEVEWLCGICLDQVNQIARGFLQQCEHVFHFDCIVKWAKITNLCPACKAPFQLVTRQDAEGTTLHIQYIEEATQQYQEQDEEDDDVNLIALSSGCSVCGSTEGTDLLLACHGEGCTTGV